MALAQLSGADLSQRAEDAVSGSVEQWTEDTLWVKPMSISQVAELLKNNDELDMEYLNSVSAIDYIGHFELVYHLTSFRKGHKATMKSRLPGREDLSAPSVYHLWRGADFQEREIWDLMGIRFDGHPNMKRIMLWEGFEGHPLRRDFLG